MTRSPSGIALWQISRGENAWHRVISYWHMQLSGRSLMFSTDDFEATEVDLETLPAHLRPKSVDELTMPARYHETGWPFAAMTCSVHWKQQIANATIIYAVRGGRSCRGMLRSIRVRCR